MSSFLRAISAGVKTCPSGGGGRADVEANSEISFAVVELKVDDWTRGTGDGQRKIKDHNERHWKRTQKLVYTCKDRHRETQRTIG